MPKSSCQALCQIKPNTLRCLCLKETFHSFKSSPSARVEQHSSPGCLRIPCLGKQDNITSDEDYPLTFTPTSIDSVRCFTEESPYSWANNELERIGPMSPESIRARTCARQFLDHCVTEKRYQSSMTGLMEEEEMGDNILRTLGTNQSQSLRYLMVGTVAYGNAQSLF